MVSPLALNYLDEVHKPQFHKRKTVNVAVASPPVTVEGWPIEAVTVGAIAAIAAIATVGAPAVIPPSSLSTVFATVPRVEPAVTIAIPPVTVRTSTFATAAIAVVTVIAPVGAAAGALASFTWRRAPTDIILATDIRFPAAGAA